jgi:hypothetical protein
MSALDYIATRIAPKFGVSAEVIAKRLCVKKLWLSTNLEQPGKIHSPIHPQGTNLAGNQPQLGQHLSHPLL